MIPTLYRHSHVCQQIPDPDLQAISYLDAKLGTAKKFAYYFMSLKRQLGK